MRIINQMYVFPNLFERAVYEMNVTINQEQSSIAINQGRVDELERYLSGPVFYVKGERSDLKRCKANIARYQEEARLAREWLLFITAYMN